MTRDPALQAKRDRGDLGTAIAVGALAIGFLLYDGIRRIRALFSVPESVTVHTPIPAQSVTADIAEGASATIHAVTMSVNDVNTISIVSLVLSIVLSIVGLIAATVFATLICQRLLRGIVFDRINTRLALASSFTLLVAGLGAMWFRTLGLNGVFAALDGEFNGQTELFVEQLPVLIAAFAVGVIVIVFRRGAALQEDAEGLV